MNLSFIDVSVKDPAIRSEIDKKYSEMISSSSFIGGEEVRLFSEEFAAYCQAAHCAPVSNGTDALILALKALGIGPGDEVITVPYTFIATTEAISAVGASIKFVDINPKSYTLEPTALEKALTPKTKAIMPVHLYGQACDMDPILEFARAHDLKVIEDAAQAHGAEYKGKRVGALGDVGCFSFYPTKNLGAFGDAGAVVSNSKEIIDRVNQIANHGRAEKYFHAIEGHNNRMDALQAAVLRIKLRHLDQWNERRRAVALTYIKALSGHHLITAPSIESYSKHVFHLFCVESSYRDELQTYLKTQGIPSGVYYPLSLHLQPAYARLGLKAGDFPFSERATSRILALPMHPHLSDQEAQLVAQAVEAFSSKG